MTTVPRISIVMPSLNHGTFIEEAIRSVVRQDYPDLEFIVVDGGSTDGSRETIERHAGCLAHRICAGDRGPADALNKGFSLATGEILGCLNADDALLPGCLATISREFVARPEADVISGHGVLAAASGELGPPMFSDPWNLTRFAHGACVLVQPATFFRRRIFERVAGFNLATHTTWDMELWADMASAGAAFYLVDAFLAVHRLHAASISGNPQLRAQRLQDARAVREKVKGRRESSRDRFYGIVHRAHKFSEHPVRTLRQRRFVHSALNRWSL